MKTRWVVSALAAVMAVGGAATAFAHDRHDGVERATAFLTGFQETPSISTAGRGTLELNIDLEDQTIDFRLRYDNLEGVAPSVTDGVVAAAHIHVSGPGVNGGVAAFLCGGGGLDPCPPPPATVTGRIEAVNVLGPGAQGIDAGEETAFAELVRAIRSGYTYVNVHTTRWPSGEIRGQIRSFGRH